MKSTDPDIVYFLTQALIEAKKAKTKNEVPVGAVVVQNKKIISRGRNTREKKQSILGHAEIEAIQKASKKLRSWRLNHCDVYVTLEPCLMCAAALQQARVRHVYFGARDKKAGVVSLKINTHHEMTYAPLLECSSILSDFFKRKRSKA